MVLGKLALRPRRRPKPESRRRRPRRGRGEEPRQTALRRGASVVRGAALDRNESVSHCRIPVLSGLGGRFAYVPQLAVKRVDGIAYWESEPSPVPERLPALCIHGWPQSSYMWRHLLPALASAGRRALAPDLHGFGDSPPDPPGTFERHVEAVE